MTGPPPRIYRFGAFTLDAAERRLERDGRPVRLKPRVFATLVFLVERAGRVVSKEELMEALWPDAVVEESNLAKTVWLARRALGPDDGEGFIETVPRAGYRFVATVEPIETAPPGAGPRKAGRSRFAAATAVLVVACSAALVLQTSRRARTTGHQTSEAPTRPSLVVLGFRNLSQRDEDAWLSTAISEKLGTSLAAGGQIRLAATDVREDRVQPVAQEETPAADQLRQIGARLGVGYVLSGSFARPPTVGDDVLRIEVLVQSTTDGATVARATQSGPIGRLSSILEGAANEVRRGIGVGPALPGDAGYAAAAFPMAAGAARAYAEGLDRLYRYDAQGARKLFERAIDLEPGFPLAHAALSQAWALLGYGPRASAEAKRAFELSNALSPAERLLAEARLAEAEGRWSDAARTYTSLARGAPDEPDFALRLAKVQTADGKGRDALATLSGLRGLPSPRGTDPRIALAEAAAWDSLSDWRRELDAAERALHEADARGARLIGAAALLQEASALQELGRFEDKRRACNGALDRFESAGDLNGAARARISLANLEDSEGDLRRAEALYLSALGAMEAVGNASGSAAVESNLALLRWQLGDGDGATRATDRVLALRRETKNAYGMAWAEATKAMILADRGVFGEALAHAQSAETLSRDKGFQDYLAFALATEGNIHRLKGDLGEAKRLLDQSTALSEKIDDKSVLADRYEDQGRLEVDRGDMAAAERLFRRELAAAQGVGEAGATAEAQLRLAEVAVDTKRHADAAAFASKAIRELEAEGQEPNATLARITMARAELEAGRSIDARAEVERALRLRHGGTPNWALLPALVAAARLEVAAGDPGAAQRLADEAASAAAGAGWVGLGIEARLVSAEIRARTNDSGAGTRERLARIASEARAHGYARLAAAADEAQRLPPGAPGGS